MNITAAVPIIFDRGWTPIPLGLDANGKPKRPIPQAWQRTPHDAAKVKDLAWPSAKGLGIVLGPASDNLAAIDIDDNALARAVFALLVRGHVKTRMVWTVSRNLHVYVREQNPSDPKTFKIKWQDREIGIELKARGQQVAAPPTPGYTLATGAWPPLDVPNVASAWASIARKLGIEEHTAPATAGYPKAWGPTVPAGDRNRAAFVEGCRLREAGVPLDQGLDYMRARWEAAYEHGGDNWREIEGTIRSAYRRGEIPQGGGTEDRWQGEI